MKINDFLKYPEHPFKTQVISEKNSEVIQVEFVFKKDESSSKPILASYPYFRANASEIIKTPRKWIVGLGEKGKADADILGAAFLSTAQKVTESLSQAQIILSADLFSTFGFENTINLLVVAFSSSTFRNGLLKKKENQTKISLEKLYLYVSTSRLEKARELVQKYVTISKHINAFRQVQILPGNFLTPSAMEHRAKEISTKLKLKLNVYSQAELEKIGAGGILAVGKGSPHESKMIVLDYNPPQAKKTIVLVGKGVTFDTGGISIKPSSGMHDMKYDMSGSGSVLHSVAAIAELGLPVRAVAVIGMAENMPDGEAIKPGDVYTALNGLTIEVQNTDAEGRLVLGDLLAFGEKEFKPDLMVDLATLTGACVVALGHVYAGIFSRQKDVIKKLQNASDASLEPVWALPMSRHYTEQLKSEIADHNNIGGRWGGPSIAASFLSLFVDEKTQWAHIDIAGVGMLDENYGVYTAHASGYGVRLLTELANALAHSK